MIKNTTDYYVHFTGKVYELRQTRFNLADNHPHDVCAVAISIAQLKDIIKILKGTVDWRGYDKKP